MSDFKDNSIRIGISDTLSNTLDAWLEEVNYFNFLRPKSKRTPRCMGVKLALTQEVTNYSNFLETNVHSETRGPRVYSIQDENGKKLYEGQFHVYRGEYRVGVMQYVLLPLDPENFYKKVYNPNQVVLED